MFLIQLKKWIGSEKNVKYLLKGQRDGKYLLKSYYRDVLKIQF